MAFHKKTIALLDHVQPVPATKIWCRNMYEVCNVGHLGETQGKPEIMVDTNVKTGLSLPQANVCGLILNQLIALNNPSDDLAREWLEVWDEAR